MAEGRLIDAYLGRLGVERTPPSATSLFGMHRAHVQRVPFENLWIHQGERWGIDPATSLERIATSPRGGYCYQLNGAFSELLTALGYHVTRHRGGVHGSDGPTEEALGNHLVLSVHDLPTDANPSGSWYVDVGLGAALLEPLPLVAGDRVQGPFRLSLNHLDGGTADWHLTLEPSAGFGGMAWRSAPATMADFEETHTFLSTSPESGFVRVLTAQAYDAAGGVNVLRGRRLEHIGETSTVRVIETGRELADVLADLYGLDVGTPGAAEALWARVTEGEPESVA